jgi:hypothetical protein
MDRDPYPHQVALVEAREVIHHLEPLLPFLMVDAADVEQQVAVELGSITECSQDLDQPAPVGGDLGETICGRHDLQVLAARQKLGERVHPRIRT